MIFEAASRSLAFRSGILRSAIARHWAAVNMPTFSRLGSPDPFSIPSASRISTAAGGIEKGSGEPNREKVGRLTLDQCRQIAERKMPDLNANDIDAASRIIAGTARSMGVEVEGIEV